MMFGHGRVRNKNHNHVAECNPAEPRTKVENPMIKFLLLRDQVSHICGFLITQVYLFQGFIISPPPPSLERGAGEGRDGH